MNKKGILAGALAAGAFFMASCSAKTQLPQIQDEQITGDVNVVLNNTANPAQNDAVIIETPDLPADELLEVPAALPDYTPVITQTAGIFKEVTDEFGVKQAYIEIPESGGPAGDLLGTIMSDTIIANAKTGAKLNIDDVQPGTAVVAFVGQQTARSIPPQADLYALITGIPDTLTGIPAYIDVYSVSKDADGGITVLNGNRDTEITIPADLAAAIPVFGDQSKTADAADVTAGTRLLAWYDAVTMSIPAQATAQKVMIIE